MIFGRKPMSCEEAASHLHELLDGELTPKTSAAVRRHLEKCSHCMSVFEFEQAFLRFVEKKSHQPGVPNDLQSRLLSRINRLEDGDSE